MGRGRKRLRREEKTKIFMEGRGKWGLSELSGLGFGVEVVICSGDWITTGMKKLC